MRQGLRDMNCKPIILCCYLLRVFLLLSLLLPLLVVTPFSPTSPSVFGVLCFLCCLCCLCSFLPLLQRSALAFAKHLTFDFMCLFGTCWLYAEHTLFWVDLTFGTFAPCIDLQNFFSAYLILTWFAFFGAPCLFALIGIDLQLLNWFLLPLSQQCVEKKNFIVTERQ